MGWNVQVLEIAGGDGIRTGKFRLTAHLDEDTLVRHYGLGTHFHDSVKLAEQCPVCEAHIARVTGHPSRMEMAEREARDAREMIERLNYTGGVDVDDEGEDAG